MPRAALLLLLLAPGIASAQGFNLPYRTGSTFYQPSFGRYAGGFYGGFNPTFRLPNAVPYNGVGYLSPGGYYDPGFFTVAGPSVVYIPSFAGEAARPTLPPAPPLVGAGVPTRGEPVTQVRGAAQPAELRVQLPTSAELWVNGAKQPGQDAVRTLTSPLLAPGATHTFDLKASWMAAGGGRYTWERSVTVAAGGRSKVAIAGGFPEK